MACAVLATGGIRFCTSATPPPPPPPSEPSVELLSEDLSWRSRFSIASAVNLSRVNETAVLGAVSSYASIHSWSFASSPASSHIGPLPLEWAQVLSTLRIASVSPDTIAAAEADGVLLTSVRELNRRLLAAERAIDQLAFQVQDRQHRARSQPPPHARGICVCFL